MIETLILGAPPAGLQLAATLALRRRAVQLLPTPGDVQPAIDPAYIHADKLRDGYSLLSNGLDRRFAPDPGPGLASAYSAYLASIAEALRLDVLAPAEVTTIAPAAEGYSVTCADGRRLSARLLVLATPPAAAAWAPTLAAVVDGNRFPQTAGWESLHAPGLFCVGALMEQRRRANAVDELPGSLRYVARALGHLLTERADPYAVWPSSAYTNTSGQLTTTLLNRAQSAAGLQWQAGFLVDVLTRRPGERAARLFKEVPAGLVGARFEGRAQTLRLSGVPGAPGHFQLDHARHGEIVDRFEGDAAAADARQALQSFLIAAMRQS